MFLIGGRCGERERDGGGGKKNRNVFIEKVEMFFCGSKNILEPSIVSYLVNVIELAPKKGTG